MDKADAIRRRNQQILEKYDQLAQAVFYDMFGDPVRNEKGWNLIPLSNSLKFLTSGSRGWAKFYSETGDLFLRIQNVGKNRLKLSDITFVNTPNSSEAKRTKVESGDIILSITADLGRTAVIPEDFPDAYINQHLAILRLKEGFNTFFVSEYLASSGGETQFRRLTKGGVKAGLNFNDIKALKILNPPIELQNKFQNIVSEIEEQKTKTILKLQNSNSLFQSLLQKAFKGELFQQNPVPNEV